MSDGGAEGHWSTSKWHEARAWHTNLALLLIGIALFCMTRQFLAEADNFWIGFSGCSTACAILYLAACWLVLTKPTGRYTFPLIIAVACACRLVTVYAEPFLSSDVYRYVWDGIVQHAHINPYRYVPGDKALTFLREPNLEVFNNINRRDYARTIYPPAAQFLFYLITFISPTLICMKTFMILFEGVTVWGLVKLLHHLGYKREQVLLYAWSPLLIWEIGGSGHLDAVAMAFITLALLCRMRLKPVLTGLFLGLAVATKLYPLVLFPALYWSGDGRRVEWKMPATMAAVVAVGYACYSSVGMLVFGFLGGYAKEEGLETGARYFLLEWAQRLPGLHHLPIGAFYGFCVLVFGAIMWWAWKTCCREPRSAGVVKGLAVKPLWLGREDFVGGSASFLPVAFALAAALMFLFAPHYPWYIAWLFPFFSLEPSLPMATYLMAFFYGYTTWLADPGPKMFLLNERLYGVTLLAFVIHMALKAWGPYRANFLAHGTSLKTPVAPAVDLNHDELYPELSR